MAVETPAALTVAVRNSIDVGTGATGVVGLTQTTTLQVSLLTGVPLSVTVKVTCVPPIWLAFGVQLNWAMFPV